MVKASRQAVLFDIRLRNLDHDVLVLKGSQQDSCSVLLSGKIVLSVLEPINIKKLTLRLYSTLRLDWNDSYQSAKGTISRPVKFEKKIYEHNWDDFDLSQYTSAFSPEHGNLHNKSTTLLKQSSSSTSLKNLGSTIRSKSSSNLSSLNLVSHSNNQVLNQGNYEFPFSAILPGSIPESVEGLPGGSVIYKLQAVMERGRFTSSLTTKKHIRVIRTLTPDSVELSETMAVDNVWPEKVEYSISIPSRAVAIGSGTPINIMLVPLLKGLKLGKIKISLVEYYSYCGSFGPTCNDERIVTEQRLPARSIGENDTPLDKWEIDSFLQFPPDLSKCTQDCDISTNMKVRHKLKFVIGLVNPDGHVSELRASLPIIIFISPFVAVRAKIEDFDSEGNSTNGDYGVSERDKEHVLFDDSRNLSNNSFHNLPDSDNGNEVEAHPRFVQNQDIVAPPMYEKHIYDRLWSEIAPIDSPTNSGTVTPSVPHSNEISNHFAMSPMDSSYNQLTENLRQLSLQRQSQENSDMGLSFSANNTRMPMFSLSGSGANSIAQTPDETSIHHNQQEDYFSVNRGTPNAMISSPGVFSPPIEHLSRANSYLLSEVNLGKCNNNSQEWNTNEISRVPSYLTAVRSEPLEDLAPRYEPPLPGSNIDLGVLDKKFEQLNQNYGGGAHIKSKLGPLSSGSGLNLRGLKHTKENISSAFDNSRSRGSSQNSSPANSANVSYTNLASLNPSSPGSNRSSGSLAINLTPMTPLSTGALHLPPLTQQAHTISNTGVHGFPGLKRSPTATSTSSSGSKSHNRSKSSSNVRPDTMLRSNSKSSTNLHLSNLPFLQKKKDENSQ